MIECFRNSLTRRFFELTKSWSRSGAYELASLHSSCSSSAEISSEKESPRTWETVANVSVEGPCRCRRSALRHRLHGQWHLHQLSRHIFTNFLATLSNSWGACAIGLSTSYYSWCTNGGWGGLLAWCAGWISWLKEGLTISWGLVTSRVRTYRKTWVKRALG